LGFSIGDYSILDLGFGIFDWGLFDLGFGIWDFRLGIIRFGIWDLGFSIGIIGVNLIFKPIINLKSDARLLFTPYSPEAGGAGGRSGERKHPR
jgi:hypothetical protein